MALYYGQYGLCIALLSMVQRLGGQYIKGPASSSHICPLPCAISNLHKDFLASQEAHICSDGLTLTSQKITIPRLVNIDTLLHQTFSFTRHSVLSHVTVNNMTLHYVSLTFLDLLILCYSWAFFITDTLFDLFIILFLTPVPCSVHSNYALPFFF